MRSNNNHHDALRPRHDGDHANNYIINQGNGGLVNDEIRNDYVSMTDNVEGQNNNTEMGENHREITQSTYRGFSTSINDMFTDPNFERVDCCALTCCGVFQSDRDRYLISGVKPPGCCKRFWVHFILPIFMFVFAGFCAVRIQDPLLNTVFSTTLVFSLVGFFIVQCLKGSMKRRHVRKDILWTKYQMIHSGVPHDRSEDSSDEDEPAAAGTPPPHYMGQTKTDIYCAHALCGCYATDKRFDNDDDNNVVDESNDNHQHVPTICTKIFRCFTKACCGILCGMQLQICGVCALGQEARQVETLLPPGYLKIDYITLQPFIQYYPQIYQARINGNHESWWWQRLSTLSLSLLGYMGCILIVLFIWSLKAKSTGHAFSPGDFMIFVATLLQAVFYISVVYYRHTKDLSLDAVIKFFASGFVLSTILAIFFELLIGLTMRVTMTILISASGVDEVDSNSFTGPWFLTPGFGEIMLATEAGQSGGYHDYIQIYGNDHPFIYTIYLLVNSFCMAALVEELCKYFGFRMVDHPDFLTRQELEETCECYDNGQEEDGHRPEDVPDFSQQSCTVTSKGAAITVGMVSTAVGFACCENLVYIFIYSDATVLSRLVVLILRSLFPIHPIAAAMQSIGVCERDLEHNRECTLGSIILPAILFHGGFDFFVLWIDYLVNRNGTYAEATDDEAVTTGGGGEVASMAVSVLMMIGALTYYYVQSRSQRERLAAMDQQASN